MEPFLVALLLGFVGIVVYYIDVIYIQKKQINTSSIIKIFSLVVCMVLLSSSLITTTTDEIINTNTGGQDMMTGNAPF